MPIIPPENVTPDGMDAEEAKEMARLTMQDRLMTKGMGGLFSERTDLSHMYEILDIACGTGAWVLDVARAYPKKQVVGIDINPQMVKYAQTQAWAQGLDNATFMLMDALGPLDFPNNSFDLVNARFLFAVVPPTAWEDFIQECLRITRSGGVIRLTESELGITNSSAVEQLNGMYARAAHEVALQVAGQSFSPDGRHMGITSVLGRFLRDAGCQNIQLTAHAIDFSKGTDAHESTCQNYRLTFQSLQPFLINVGITMKKEVESIHQQMVLEMMSEEFCGITFLLTACGEKPLGRL